MEKKLRVIYTENKASLTRCDVDSRVRTMQTTLCVLIHVR